MERTRISLITMATLAAGVAMFAPKAAEAQQVAVGVQTVSVRSTVSQNVPYRLRLSAPTAVRIVERTAEHTEIEFTVEAAANARWRLEMTSEAGDLDVQCETGDWISLAEGATAPVVFVRAPTNPTLLVVRIRVRGKVSAAQLARVQLVLRPITADQGAVSVSWTVSE